MREHVEALLWSWALLSPLLFRFLPGRDAAIACLILGWAFLPVAPYRDADLADTLGASSRHALAIPTAAEINKGSAIGLGCLAGLVLFDRRTFARFRPGPMDLPIGVWCFVPLASSIANHLPISEGLTQVRYLALAWGVPYLMGRVYLGVEASRVRFAEGLTAGGIAYLPICLIEFLAGPMVYRLAYGAHPYEFEGAARAIGSRPLGFLEHGNQLGIWMATAAVASTWLWASGASKRPGGIPGGPLAATLIGATILCQSHASILLMGLALIPLLVALPRRGATPWVKILGGGVGVLGLLLVLLAARRGYQAGALRADLANFFRSINKASFTWRLARSEDFLPIAMQRPILGWGVADWRAGGLPFVNPVNLPLGLLIPGMFGAVGVGSLLAVWGLPAIRAIRSRHPSFLSASGGASGALLAVLAVNFLDSFSNSTMILPVIAALGALNSNRPDPSHPDRS